MLRLGQVMVVVALVGMAGSAKVKISNTEPRRDTAGTLMDMHDGNIINVDGTYYYFGMGYGDCALEKGLIPPTDCPGIYRGFGGSCGFRMDHTVSLYTSPDLASWTFVAEILTAAARPEGIYFRPKVVRHPSNGHYVLWINYLPPASRPLWAYPNAGYLRFTSVEPHGPYTVVGGGEPARTVATGAGDFDIFTDEDGAAYLAYDAWGNNHKVSIERLTDDYLDTMGADASTGPISAWGNEAPIMFCRKGTYYLTFGPVCCFCHEGSGSLVYTASAPMGPWTAQRYDLNPKSWWLGSRPIRAQQSFVVQLPGDRVIYSGDLWTSAPDGIKGHDLQYWQPLAFDDGHTPPLITPLQWVDSFEIDTSAAPDSEVAVTIDGALV